MTSNVGVGKQGSGINMVLSQKMEKKSTNYSSVNQGNNNKVHPQQQQFSSQYTNQQQYMEKCQDVTHYCPQCKNDVGIAKYSPF